MEIEKNKLREIIMKKKSIDTNVSLLHWELETVAPKKGQSAIIKLIGEQSLRSFEIITSKELVDLVEKLWVHRDLLDEIEIRELKELRKGIEKRKNIPPEEFREFSELRSSAQCIWEEARKNSDFKSFAPSLEKIFSYTKKFIDYRGENSDTYDTILSDYEEGISTVELDHFFKELKGEIVPLLKLIKEKNIDFSHKVQGKCSEEIQKKYAKYLAEYLNFDFDRGILSESAHPFTLTINSDDVRMTTRYFEEAPLSSVFGVLHETGHGIYEQGVGEKLKNTVLSSGTSMGIHESQSRFYENMLGRSLPFWKNIYGGFQEKFSYLENISLDEFYRGINSVAPSLIRVEADELTYSLHIMIRYEIEKGLFNGEYSVDNLPEIWNKKIEEYLGIVPKNDSEGVLQDVHWGAGLIGYFPSYALGSAYAVQIYNAMKKELDIEKLLEEGKLVEIKKWLEEKIHSHGKALSPSEILLYSTGEEFNPKHYTDYLKRKYLEIYGL